MFKQEKKTVEYPSSHLGTTATVVLDVEHSDRHVIITHIGEYVGMEVTNPESGSPTFSVSFTPQVVKSRTEYKESSEPVLGEFFD